MFKLANIFAFLQAWSTHMQVELKLSAYESYLKLRALLGMEAVI